jgi:thiamine biosynthesis lipoprotein
MTPVLDERWPAPSPTDTAAVEWSVWSTTARVVVTDPVALDAACAVVRAMLELVDDAANRFRPDSEISMLNHATARRPNGINVRVSGIFAELMAAALEAARRTGGDVDPTVGTALMTLGYDRDISLLPGRTMSALTTNGGAAPVRVWQRPTWEDVQLDGRELTVPGGVCLDLGATAKAYAADRCAELVSTRLDTGVLVSLGGDIATAGPAPAGGWRVTVQDGENEPASAVAMPAGAAIATSSTLGRQWRNGDRIVHHIINPRTGGPAEQVWRTATVAAGSAWEANSLSTAALVRGRDAYDWLGGLDVPARLVTAAGQVRSTKQWPAGREAA